jgi:hypothetical protein
MSKTPTTVKLAERPEGCAKARRVGVVTFSDADGRELGRTTGGEFTAADELTVPGKVPKGACYCDVQFLDGPPFHLFRVALAPPDDKEPEKDTA